MDKNKMTANIENVKAGLNRSHRKEKYYSCSFTVLAVKNDEICKLASLAIYEAPSVTYACLWANYIGANGSGKAGGGGYCKRSAAAEDAFRTAGIELSKDISGRGESYIEEALKALGEEIAKKHGYTSVTVLKTNG